MDLKYLITGTGRCGTVYMARLLTNCGVPCCHEGVFDWQGIDRAEAVIADEAAPYTSFVSQKRWNNETSLWEDEEKWLPENIQAESSYMVAPFLTHTLVAGIPVIHVVRDPIKVVHSFVDHLEYFLEAEPTQSYENFIYSCLPELRQEIPPHDRAALFYVKWNELIEAAKPAHFHRIEDDPQPLLAQLGLKGELPPPEVNSIKRPHGKKFSLDQIRSRAIRNDLRTMGRRYGYSVRSEYLLM